MTREQLKNIPKGEFHLHFEGALPFKLLQEINPKKYSDEPESWKSDYRCPNFEAFDKILLGMAEDYYTSIRNYRRAAKAIFADAIDHNIRYLETSIASGAIDFQNLNGAQLFKAVKEAVPEGLTVRLFMGIHHTGFTKKMTPIIEESLSWPELDGYDLHGVEYDPLDPPIVDFWKRAGDAGKYTKSHAGEFCGPEFIRWAIDQLKVTRIEHGIRSVEDPALLKEMARRNIVCDVCPISNVKLRAAASYKDHPIKEMIAAGVKCTVNRDDPLCFGNTIVDDYAILQKETGLSDKEIIQLIKNGFEEALVNKEQKELWLREIETFTDKHSIIV